MKAYFLILMIIISLTNFIFFILTLTRWILLLTRTKQLFHQKVFFLLIWLYCLARCITLILFAIPKTALAYTLQLNESIAIETDLLITAFLSIIFTLNQIPKRNFYENFTENYDYAKKKKKKKIFISLFIIFDIIFVSIHIWLVFKHYEASTRLLSLSFIIISIGFLIYSVKLSKNSEYPKQSKKFLIVFLICTICFLLEIPILVLWIVYDNEMTIEQTNILYTVDLIVTELIPVGLITFSMFSVPIRPTVMDVVNLQLFKGDYD
ncbi:hypothetical protein M0811_10883 [Anaeramoeba ignava]|uniref:Uncharacterized protein n=1 Tax=Anaeramoeba ignava TaxID=1746090 RepID=A0A9Q0LCY4_ANAIG|nr:hypothetical protein M0811_10883 [Anaeramoeba ignava]